MSLVAETDRLLCEPRPMLSGRVWSGDQYIRDAAFARRVFSVAAGPFSVEFWFKQQQGGNFVGNFGGCETAQTVGLHQDTNLGCTGVARGLYISFFSAVEIHLSDGTSDLVLNVTGSIDGLNGWHHLVLNADRPAGSLTAYLDNVSIASTPILSNGAFTCFFDLFRSWNTVSSSFVWFLGPVAAHTVILSATQRADSLANRKVQALGTSSHFSYSWKVEDSDEVATVRSRFDAFDLDTFPLTITRDAITNVELAISPDEYQTFTSNVGAVPRIHDDNERGIHHYLNSIAVVPIGGFRHFDGFASGEWDSM